MVGYWLIEKKVIIVLLQVQYSSVYCNSVYSMFCLLLQTYRRRREAV
jgi:hypothetical protein